MYATHRPLVFMLLFLCVLSACQHAGPEAALPEPPESETWLGRWNGPEGTWLLIAGMPAAYAITIADLDGPRNFPGVATSTGIRFERDGIQETLHATNGAETGMKWLSAKENCLTVRPGEGYCRD